MCICATLLWAMALISCEKAELGQDEEKEIVTADSSKGKSVSISLRSASSSPIEYPVYIYAFDDGGICRASAVITDGVEGMATVKLPKGIYRLTAVSLPSSYPPFGGAVSGSSVLRMPDSGYATSPFATGNADIIVTSSASQSVSVRMGYRQAAVNVRLLNTPENVTAMDISLSAPYRTMSLGGSYGEAKTVTIPSVRTGGVWSTGTFYIMPTSPSQTMLTMHLTFADGSSESYSYTYNATLDAGIPYVFTGNYAGGESDADITASIQGGEWGTPVETDFDFGPGVGNVTGTNETVWNVSALPKPGDIINGHVVVISHEISSEESEILLVSLDEWSGVYSMVNEEKSAETTALINRYVENGQKDWRLPTEAEARELNKLYSSEEAIVAINAVIVNAGGIGLSRKNDKGDNVRYLCGSGKTTFSFLANGNVLSAGATVTYNMRLVKSITAKLKQ